MKKLAFAALLGLSLESWAYSFINPDTVVYSQNDFGRVTVAYQLEGQPAVVSMTVRTNGVEVSGLGGLTGDVNKLVEPGSRTITWTPDDSWERVKLKNKELFVKLTVESVNHKPDYMAVNLSDGSVAYYDSAAAVPGGVQADNWKTTHMLFRRVHAANVTARLGCGQGEHKSAYTTTLADGNNTNLRDVDAYTYTFDDDYYLAIYETTQGQYHEIAGTYPSTKFTKTAFDSKTSNAHYAVHQTDWVQHPVESVTHAEAEAAGTTVSTRVGNGLAFTLPTEQQWEYACRAGCPADHYDGSAYAVATDTMATFAATYQGSLKWYGNNTATWPTYCTLPVGKLLPNDWGFYDMFGNVREWCAGEITEGSGFYNVRGGDSVMTREAAYAAARDGFSGKSWRTGFRLCCNLPK